MVFLRYIGATVLLVAVLFALYGAASFVRPFLTTPETPQLAAVVTAPVPVAAKPPPAPPPPPHFHYIEIIDGCGPYYTEGTCVNMRAGPGEQFAVVGKLRTGIVLKVEATTTAQGGHDWYRVIFDPSIRYPERVSSSWNVAVDAQSVRPFEDIGDRDYIRGKTATTTKLIIVNLTENTLYAYDGDTLFMDELISPGLELTPTPRGVFTVYHKTPSRYMQGPLPGVSDQFYDLPGVPWNLYFTGDGAVIHGAYWHDHFGKPWSHGCVNLAPSVAQKLYEWADVGTKVIVRD